MLLYLQTVRLQLNTNNNSILSTMEASKELTAKQIATEILEKTDEVIEYGVAPTGQFFMSHTEAVNSRYKVRAYMRVRVGDKIMIHRNSNPSEIALVSELVKQGWADVREVRGITDKEPCPKCPGTGYIDQYAHVENGLCFKCNGTGHK